MTHSVNSPVRSTPGTELNKWWPFWELSGIILKLGHPVYRRTVIYRVAMQCFCYINLFEIPSMFCHFMWKGINIWAGSWFFFCNISHYIDGHTSWYQLFTICQNVYIHSHKCVHDVESNRSISMSNTFINWDRDIW